MKPARPDVRHPRIVLAGCPRFIDGDGDDDGLVAALRNRGLHAHWLAWDDPQVGRADLVILRATWDYADRLGEFLAWTTAVANLLNSPAVVAWNSDRRYLLDLADRGVPTVTGDVFAPGQPVRLPRTDRVVVKPTVGSGCTRHFTEHSQARAYASQLQSGGRTVLVQPYDARVEGGGETELVFLGGKPSHAFTKQQSLTAAEPDFELWAVGSAALAAAGARLGIDVTELLYARVGLIGGIDDPALLELDLIAPSLGWRRLGTDTRDLRQREFAVCVESALDRLGLGPLSHRRP